MKISKFVRTVKRCGMCVLYHGPGGEIWLSNNEAVYRAEEMPDMTVGQLRAVLDVPEKAWNKIVKIERHVESLRNMEGLNLEQDGDELEVVQMPDRVVPGALACYKAEKTGELFFVDDGLLCPIEGKRKISQEEGRRQICSLRPLRLDSKWDLGFRLVLSRKV